MLAYADQATFCHCSLNSRARLCKTCQPCCLPHCTALWQWPGSRGTALAVLLASHCVGYHGLETSTQLCVDVLVHCTCLRGYLPPPSPLLLYQIDFDESASQNRFTVKPGVDPELDESEHCQSTNHQETLCCAVLCCAVLWCGVVWCGVVWCGVVV